MPIIPKHIFFKNREELDATLTESETQTLIAGMNILETDNLRLYFGLDSIMLVYDFTTERCGYILIWVEYYSNPENSKAFKGKYSIVDGWYMVETAR